MFIPASETHVVSILVGSSTVHNSQKRTHQTTPAQPKNTSKIDAFSLSRSLEYRDFTSHHFTSWCFTSHHFTSCFYITPFYIVMFYITPFYSVILHHAVLHRDFTSCRFTSTRTFCVGTWTFAELSRSVPDFWDFPRLTLISMNFSVHWNVMWYAPMFFGLS